MLLHLRSIKRQGHCLSLPSNPRDLRPPPATSTRDAGGAPRPRGDPTGGIIHTPEAGVLGLLLPGKSRAGGQGGRPATRPPRPPPPPHHAPPARHEGAVRPTASWRRGRRPGAWGALTPPPPLRRRTPASGESRRHSEAPRPRGTGLDPAPGPWSSPG